LGHVGPGNSDSLKCATMLGNRDGLKWAMMLFSCIEFSSLTIEISRR
jgi:hypothetical protein